MPQITRKFLGYHCKLRSEHPRRKDDVNNEQFPSLLNKACLLQLASQNSNKEQPLNRIDPSTPQSHLLRGKLALL